MFKLVPNLTCWWPVKVSEPDPNKPGKFIEHTFEAELQILDRDESQKADEQRRAMLKQAADDPSDENLAKVEKLLEAHDQMAFRRVLRNWRGLIDENDQPIPFTDETFVAVMKHDRVRRALNVAYQEAITGDKARLGN